MIYDNCVACSRMMPAANRNVILSPELPVATKKLDFGLRRNGEFKMVPEEGIEPPTKGL
jgi:hypothetical protein